MPGWRTALIALVAALLYCAAAGAAVGDISYGPWSEWSDQAIEYKTDLFVETREVSRPVTRRAFRYVRYRAPGQPEGYVAFSSQAPGAAQEVMEVAEPLKAVGERDGHVVYEGEWFNQQALIQVDHLVPVTQYRAREIFLVYCALEPSSLILDVGEHKALGIRLLDPGGYSLTSDNPLVLSVDQQGLLSAHAPGRARVTLLYEGRTAACEVLVSAGRAAPEQGYGALRLSGTRLTARYDAGKKQVTGLALAAEPEGGKADPGARFLVCAAEGGLFSLRALCPRIAYLTAPRADDGRIVEGAAEVLMLADILARERQIARARSDAASLGAIFDEAPREGGTAFDEYPDDEGAFHRFRATETPEGDLIVQLQSDPGWALAASGASEGCGLAVRPLDLSDPLQRWTLTPEAQDVGADSVWRLPVADNSFNQITDDFKTMARDKDKHDGVDFSPTGDKTAVAVASGRVLRVDDRCTHDYRKTKKNKYGRYIDPCDVADGRISKYGSYGKYAVIEHEDGTRTLYAHLSKLLVKPGQKVKKGQAVGKMGSTGSSNGTHLHFEVRVGGRAVNPRYFLDLPAIGQYVP